MRDLPVEFLELAEEAGVDERRGGKVGPRLLLLGGNKKSGSQHLHSHSADKRSERT